MGSPSLRPRERDAGMVLVLILRFLERAKNQNLTKLQHGQVWHVDNAHDAAINALAIDPNGGNWVLTAGEDGWAKVFDVRAGKMHRVLASPRKISEGTWVGSGEWSGRLHKAPNDFQH